MTQIALRDQVDALRRVLVDHTKSITAALPPDSISPVRFQHSVIMCVQQNPALLRCDPKSLLGSALRAAHLGLDLDIATGQAFLVPFKNVVQLIVGYRGLVNLAWRSGMLSKISASVVRDGDDFDYALGTEEYVRHKPRAALDAPVTHAYAVARVVGANDQLFVVLTKEKIDKIRASSASAKSATSPWHTHPDEMACKTALRRLCKVLPMTGEKAKHLAVAADLDERADLGLKQSNVEDLLDAEESTEESQDGANDQAGPGSDQG